MKTDDWYPNNEIISECCGVSFNEDYGICPDCGEHCERAEIEPEEDELPQ